MESRLKTCSKHPEASWPRCRLSEASRVASGVGWEVQTQPPNTVSGFTAATASPDGVGPGRSLPEMDTWPVPRSTPGRLVDHTPMPLVEETGGGLWSPDRT